ncbi:MAG: DUF2281 domain-containing protein [Betaproteobacteria bacterium]|nr:DUF2281 domain-containing protein [Betaproteobacteria bacterium]
MSNPSEGNILEKLKELPPERVAEVEDFVDFLRARTEEQRLVKSVAKASEPAFTRVWDNPEDADYDRL